MSAIGGNKIMLGLSGKKAFLGVAAIALVAAGCHSSSTTPQQSSQQTPPAEISAPAPTSIPQTLVSANTWMGTLKTSDNSKKGNLMLMTDTHTIYINTSRDYSALLDKKVNVTFVGSLDSFTLGDITAQ